MIFFIVNIFLRYRHLITSSTHFFDNEQDVYVGGSILYLLRVNYEKLYHSWAPTRYED